MLHALKTLKPYFDSVVSGEKTFDVRKHDRPFEVGDVIVLQEWDNEAQVYSGREWNGNISYILDTPEYCKKGYCILGLKVIK